MPGLRVLPTGLQAMVHGGAEAGSIAGEAGVDTGLHVVGLMGHDRVPFDRLRSTAVAALLGTGSETVGLRHAARSGARGRQENRRGPAISPFIVQRSVGTFGGGRCRCGRQGRRHGGQAMGDAAGGGDPRCAAVGPMSARLQAARIHRGMHRRGMRGQACRRAVGEGEKAQRQRQDAAHPSSRRAGRPANGHTRQGAVVPGRFKAAPCLAGQRSSSRTGDLAPARPILLPVARTEPQPWPTRPTTRPPNPS